MVRRRTWPAVIGFLLVTGTALAGCGGASPAPGPQQSLSADIDGAMAAQPGFDDIRAILVTRNGRPVLQRYFGATAEQTWNLSSVTEAVLSTLVGIAVDEGRFRSLDVPLKELLPAYAVDMTPRTARTTLRQLVTMTAGLRGVPTSEERYPRFTQERDWVRGIVTSISPTAPRPAFTYSDADAHLVAAALEQATGRSVLDYARVKLFGPLGIEIRPGAQPTAVRSTSSPALSPALEGSATSAWPVDPQGVNLGWTLLRMRPDDVAKLGRLYLQSGRWNGRQVVSSSWVQAATAPQVPATGVRVGAAPEEGYGYLWWVGTADGDPAYFARGFGGQLVELVPARGLEVVVVSEFDPGDPTSFGTPAGLLMSLVNDTIAPHFRW